MFLHKSAEKASSLAEQASDATEQAIKSTQQVAHQVSALTNRSIDRVLEASHQLRAKAEHASHDTARYIRHEPFKSVLIAAVAGAALMALVSLASRSHDHR